MQEEIWKDILDYQGLYQISNLGRLKSIRFNRIIKGSITRDKYVRFVPKINKKHGKPMRVHQLVFNAFIGNYDKSLFVIDHIDGNTMNNNISNLRLATFSQNQFNQKKMNRNTSSIFKGVYWYKRYGNWNAQIVIDGKKKNLGYFKSEREAANIYNMHAVKLFGQFASLNIVD